VGTRFSGTGLSTRAGKRGQFVAGATVGKGVGLLAVLLLMVLVLVPASASAEPLCTDTWTGPAEGEWQTESDWSTGKVPTSASVACIGAEKTVNIPNSSFQVGVLLDKGALVIQGGASLEVTNALEASSIHSLTLSHGTLTGIAQVDVTSSFSAGGYSALSGSGGVIIESGATGTISSAMYLSTATLKNTGTLTISGSGYIQGEGHGVVTNSGTLYVNREGEGLEGREATLVNTGAVKKTEGARTTIIGMVVENESSITTTVGMTQRLHSFSASIRLRALPGHPIHTQTITPSPTPIRRGLSLGYRVRRRRPK
jgi:hypothetical protein